MVNSIFESNVTSKSINRSPSFPVDVTSLNDFNVNKSTTLPPFDLDKPFNLVDQSVSCPPVKATVKIDVDAKAHAVASIGLAASGTILPPNVESFAVIVGRHYFLLFLTSSGCDAENGKKN
jgi:hypothetical protein